MADFKGLIRGTPLLPILQPDTVEQAVNIAGAVYASGLRSVEVVRRTSAAAAAVSAIRETYPDLLVGMGTVLNAEHVREAVDAGSQFIITPTISEKLLTALSDSPVPYLPGTASPSDILLAVEAGLSEVKFFPAAVCGGAAMLNNYRAIFPEVSLCPTGGISGDNLHEFSSLPNVFAVGGSWMIPKACVAESDWQGITAACSLAQQQYTKEPA
ncbi:bifunctional 4-hydroxy-2-oxoglutarate aldolase/2-dehydro-3-deoxy-phosphogluconate aldolase [Alteromonas lipolytica]|uniref:Keto-deoxy-phosphogluconate aldolase n=1 Tax=Alteromonas lipolytica TaxID=1856405 RepID=A0A1E8FJF1_9ALTE|nr:bifunctional 4-hydroxy-2-oxoglutarate aldolase/2-dehydro-3-deoxy-phosphogluconate aldolase [Alteromonas lipolytica]OFI35563.1 keto-deoxy-phosphogluconate aldolase [Alteromonas lipolytica]GGF77215.1 ketohydroxyglutarate aldolase [Alteromonas lipolytica]